LDWWQFKAVLVLCQATHLVQFPLCHCVIEHVRCRATEVSVEPISFLCTLIVVQHLVQHYAPDTDQLMK